MGKMMLNMRFSPTTPIPWVPAPPGIPSPVPITTITTQSGATFSTFVSASKDGGSAPHTADVGVVPLPFLGNLVGLPAQIDYLSSILVNSIAVSVRKPFTKKVAKVPAFPIPIRAHLPSVPPVPVINLVPPIFPAFTVPPLLASLIVVEIRK